MSFYWNLDWNCKAKNDSTRVDLKGEGVQWSSMLVPQKLPQWQSVGGGASYHRMIWNSHVIVMRNEFVTRQTDTVSQAVLAQMTTQSRGRVGKNTHDMIGWLDFLTERRYRRKLYFTLNAIKCDSIKGGSFSLPEDGRTWHNSAEPGGIGNLIISLCDIKTDTDWRVAGDAESQDTKPVGGALWYYSWFGFPRILNLTLGHDRLSCVMCFMCLKVNRGTSPQINRSN